MEELIMRLGSIAILVLLAIFIYRYWIRKLEVEEAIKTRIGYYRGYADGMKNARRSTTACTCSKELPKELTA